MCSKDFNQDRLHGVHRRPRLLIQHTFYLLLFHLLFAVQFSLIAHITLSVASTGLPSMDISHTSWHCSRVDISF